MSTVVPSVTGPASAFLRLSFTSTMLSSRSTRLRSSTLHSSSISLSFCSRLATAPLSAERSQQPLGNSLSAGSRAGGRTDSYTHHAETRPPRGCGPLPWLRPSEQGQASWWVADSLQAQEPRPRVSILQRLGRPREQSSAFTGGLNVRPSVPPGRCLGTHTVTAASKGESFNSDLWRTVGLFQLAPHGSFSPPAHDASLGLMELWSSTLPPSQPCLPPLFTLVFSGCSCSTKK